ncbi:DUF4011 domain-containing protein [Deinococcus malanensis]|uniref:DUF4011 domain-containing protein n=1 Tax=Deinococcus malanensis TaxID=1706855 RepID=UPI00362DB308
MAATLMPEQGMHALYMGVGFLEWYESPDSDKKRYAPIFLIPVTLERKNVSSGYRLVYSGDDVAGNEPLALRLRQDFGIEIPAVKVDEPDFEGYLAGVTQAVAGQKRWVVHQHAHLGFFSFSRYLMARDLEAGEVTRLEAAFGQSLPDDLRTLYLTFDGQASAEQAVALRLMSTAEVMRVHI